MIDPLGAIGALSMTPVSAAAGAAQASGASLSQALGQTFAGAVASLQNGEAAAIQGLQGTMPMSQVVDSVMGAQRTLQSALAIRDKAVSAWQDISRMAI